MTTAIDINTGKIVTVKPIAVYGSDAFDTLLIADANTGKGMWFGYDTGWLGYDTRWHIDLEDDDLDYTAERIDGIYGSYETEWEAAANMKLADYGLKLGEFDEANGDRYTLVEA